MGPSPSTGDGTPSMRHALPPRGAVLTPATPRPRGLAEVAEPPARQTAQRTGLPVRHPAGQGKVPATHTEPLNAAVDTEAKG